MELVAVILAGGKSKRMGKDKADILWHGQALWEYQQQKLISCGFSSVWVARNKPDFLQDDEAYKHQGPLSGIFTALKKAKAEGYSQEYILFLPVDMPYISIDMLISLAQNTQKQATYFTDEFFPLMLNLSALTILQNYLLSQKRSVYGFLSLLNVHQLKKSTHYNFTNMNRLQDLPQHII